METEFRLPIEKYEEKSDVTSDRKLAHLQICLEHDVQARNVTTGLEDISFVHRATTDLKLEDIDLGGYHMFLKTKNNVIFTYIIDDDNHSDNIKRYMQLVMEEFIDKYYYSQYFY